MEEDQHFFKLMSEFQKASAKQTVINKQNKNVGAFILNATDDGILKKKLNLDYQQQYDKLFKTINTTKHSLETSSPSKKLNNRI